MDNLHLLGSIASIISLFIPIPLGFIIWGFIKKRKTSFFHLYMLVIVLIQFILVVYWLWDGKNVIAVLTGMFLMFMILFWLVLYLNERQIKIIEAIAKQSEIMQSQSEIMQSQSEFVTESNKRHIESFMEFIDITKIIVIQIDNIGDIIRGIIKEITKDNIKNSHVYTEVKIDVNTKQLENELEKIKKQLRKIETQKLTK